MGQGFPNQRNGIAISAGTGLAQSGTVVFSNSNNISFGAQLSASSIVVTASVIAIGSISAGTTRITSGEVVLSNSNGISFGANGQTITAALPYLSYWDNHFNIQLTGAPLSSSIPNLVIQLARFGLPIAATRMDLIANLTVNGSTAGSYTISIGIYTMSGSTASRASSSSVAVTWNSGTNSTAASIYGGQSGNRWRSVPTGTWNISEGNYLLGVICSVSGVAGTTAGFSFGGQAPVGNTLLLPGGGNFSAYFADGVFSTGTGALPASIHLSDILQTYSTGAFNLPYMQLAGTF